MLTILLALVVASGRGAQEASHEHHQSNKEPHLSGLRSFLEIGSARVRTRAGQEHCCFRLLPHNAGLALVEQGGRASDHR
jgi:hypothetical protein